MKCDVLSKRVIGCAIACNVSFFDSFVLLTVQIFSTCAHFHDLF